MRLFRTVPIIAVFAMAVAVVGCKKNAGNLHPLLGLPPASVVDTINKELDGGSVNNVGYRTRDGQSSYWIQIQLPNELQKNLEISTSGEILSMRRELEEMDLPPEIAASVQKRLPAGGKFAGALEIVAGGTTNYRVQIERAGQQPQNLLLSDKGAVLSTTEGNRRWR